MTTNLFRLAPLLACVAAPVAAQSDPTPRQMEAATRYALPHLFQGYRAACAATLAPDGYVTAQGDRLQAKFSEGADAFWPDAKSVMLDFAAQQAGGSASEVDLFSALPDENLQPFVDGMISALVLTEIKPDRCADVERGLQLLDPMPTQNIAGLMGFLFEMVQENREKSDAAAEGSGAGR